MFSMPEALLEPWYASLADPYDVSASEIKLWKECNRKWGWKYIGGLKGPDSAAAALGKETHAILEQYHKDGLAWDYTRPAGEIAAKALDYVPRPGTGIPEEEFRVADGDLLWKGFRDLVVPTGPEVWDYKTTSDLMWAKTPQELSTDPQGVIYAKITLDEYKASAVDLKWLYLKSRKPYASRLVQVTMHREHTEKEFSALRDLARHIAATYSTTTDVLALPANTDACDNYGGCPHLSLCKISPGARMATFIRRNKEMGLIDDLKKRQASAPPPEAPKPEGRVVVVQSYDPQAKDPYSKKEFTIPTVTVAPVTITLNNPEAIQEQAVAAVKEGVISVYGPINPPESTVILPPEPDNVDQSAKPKRTRRTKAQIEADNAALVAAAGTTLADPIGEAIQAGIFEQAKILTYDIPADAIQAAVDAVTPPYPGFTLFVDCWPSHDCVYADHYIKQANDQICEEFKVADYRMVDYKGPAMLSTIVLQLVKEAKPLAIYLDSDTPQGKACLSALTAESTTIVRSVR